MNAQLKADPASLIAAGRRALEIEGRAIAALVPRLDATFARACSICLECRGRVIVSGMGKSGHIAGKIAATLASTGTPSFFMHAAEASHGDIGMITREDVLLAISNSGETAEVLLLIPHLVAPRGSHHRHDRQSRTRSLARASTVHLDVSVAEEACPLNLAPTASTTATLAVGDALAVATARSARLHLAGFRALASGWRARPQAAVARRRRDAHAATNYPSSVPAASLAEGLVVMSKKGLGMCVVVDAGQHARRLHRRRPAPRARSRIQRPQDHDARGHDLTRQTRRRPPSSRPKRPISWRNIASPHCRWSTHRASLVGALNVHDLLRAGVL